MPDSALNLAQPQRRSDGRSVADRAPSEPPAPAVALQRLRAGNQRFVSGRGAVVNRWRPGLSSGQEPFAVVLGCADSRAPAEFVFDQGLGDLFVVRVAGNIVAPSLVGSIEFATQHFGTRLVVVMGHTHCGAVSATVSALENEAPPASRNMRSIVDRIEPQVRQVLAEALEPEARLARAVRVNALASARALLEASPALRSSCERGQTRIVAAVYNLATGWVEFLEPPAHF